MSDEISWQVELIIKPEHLDAFRSLTNEMIEATRLEEGVLMYERFLGETNNRVFVYERYINSAAALAHLQAFQETFAAAFSRLVKRQRFLVFGSPSDDLRAVLSGFDATFLSPMAGFSVLGSEIVEAPDDTP